MANGWIESQAKVEEFLKNTKAIFKATNDKISVQTTRYSEDPKSPRYQYTTAYTLSTLRYDDEDVVREIKSLSIHDYVETVEDEKRNGAPDFWVFEKVIQGRSIYIKYKIRNARLIYCMSFHFPEFPVKAKPY